MTASNNSFAVYVEPQTIEVDSDTYNASNSAAYEAALEAVLPVCIQRARANNKWAMDERIESERKQVIGSVDQPAAESREHNE